MDTLVILLLTSSLISLVIIISLIVKFWNMSNDVYAIRSMLIKEQKQKYSIYDWRINHSKSVFDRELEKIDELLFCDKVEEAKVGLKRLRFQLMMETRDYEKIEIDIQ